MPRPRKSLASISIPVRGDRAYREKVNDLAIKKDRFVADLVREAMDAHYGNELPTVASFLLAENVSQKKQTGLAKHKPLTIDTHARRTDSPDTSKE